MSTKEERHAERREQLLASRNPKATSKAKFNSEDDDFEVVDLDTDEETTKDKEANK